MSGAYTLSDAGHDAYTVNETGGTQNVSMGVSGTWGQSLSGGDNYDTTETGNELSGFFTRTITGSGTDVLSETGSIAGMPYNNTPATAYTLSETGNYLSGSLSMTETGEDRHSIIQIFDNTSNATTHNGPGIVDYSPVGAPITSAA